VLLRGEDPPPSAVVVQANYRDNPWLPDVLKGNWSTTRSATRRSSRMCGWASTSATRSAGLQELDGRGVRATGGHCHRLGADWGYAIDPSVLVRCSIDGKRLYVDHEAYMIGCEIDAAAGPVRPRARCPQVVHHGGLCEARDHQLHAEARLSQDQRAIKGPRSVEEGIAFLQSYDIVVHPRCQHVIDELTLYSYKTDPLTGKVLPLLEDKHNHCIDSSALCLRRGAQGTMRALTKSCASGRLITPSASTTIRIISSPTAPTGNGASSPNG
jgi:phage terminase large subunit